MKTYQNLVNACLKDIAEIMPWDLQAQLEKGESLLILDIREPYEFQASHIQGSLNVPRGILEPACEYGYEDTVAELAAARDKDIVIVCRSGNRSVLAAYTLQLMGYQSVKSLKTGLKGWNDYEQPLQDIYGQIVDGDVTETLLKPPLRPEQLPPKHGLLYVNPTEK
ncbi:MAG: sulfurtransferase [Beggiatoa sp. IS2]|nr:MAG: sulfurtransferase [Beggiatoa sp. IS2]